MDDTPILHVFFRDHEDLLRFLERQAGEAGEALDDRGVSRRRGGDRMTTQRFIIHSDLPGLNELVDARIRQGQARGRKQARWNAYSDLKRHWMEILVPLARSQLRPVTGPARFKFIYFEPHRRRDPDNIAAGAKKFILDALVEAGILANDGQKNVAGWTEEWYVARQPRVEVFLEEA